MHKKTEHFNGILATVVFLAGISFGFIIGVLSAQKTSEIYRKDETEKKIKQIDSAIKHNNIVIDTMSMHKLKELLSDIKTSH